MKNTNIRIERINKLIQKKIHNIIKNELITLELITVTFVKTLPDLSETHVYILVFNNSEKVLINLNKRATKIQNCLSKVIKLRKFPKIKFFHDKQMKCAIDVFNLIDNI